MPKKWNLQDIRPARPAEREQRPEPTHRRINQDIAPRRPAPTQEEPVYDPDLGKLAIIDGNASKRKRAVAIGVVTLLILAGAFFVNVLMGGAQVTVYPKFKDVSVQATFTAMSVPAAGELGYELLSLEASGERQVKASGSEQVSEPASGKILIYNTDTKASQRLIKNTRFESPTGLIYRIKESVEVPAASQKSDVEIVPGVVSADVFADGPGDQYNIEPSRFTVPGLKGTPQFNTVYGESTVAMSGGFEGERYMLDEAELETKKQELHLELRNSLLERLKTERPAGFIVYDNAVTFTFESLPSTSFGDSMATIKEKAELHVPLFKEDEFAAYLAESTIPGYEGEPVTLTDPATLTFEYADPNTSLNDISDDTSLEFLLKGNTRIVWKFDEDKLKADLLGLDKSALPSVLGAYPSIDRAEAVIRPFWTQSFPETEEKLNVTTIVEKKGAKDQ